jgi:DNA primase
MVTPNEVGRKANRIIIPFTHKNKIVGHTSRFIDNLQPKYDNQSQTGYLFGIDLQKSNWQFVILVEGIFDAIAINGCALAHNGISKEQSMQLNNMRKQIIFVPDQDKTGLSICEEALSLGYSVSIPRWGNGVKDTADSVQYYGKLPTLLSIIQNSTTNRVKIELRKKQILKGEK